MATSFNYCLWKGFSYALKGICFELVIIRVFFFCLPSSSFLAGSAHNEKNVAIYGSLPAFVQAESFANGLSAFGGLDPFEALHEVKGALLASPQNAPLFRK